TENRAAGAPHRRGGRGGGRPATAVAQVHQPHAPAERGREPGGDRAVVPAQRAQHVGQGGVAGVVAEQVGGDPVRQPQAAGAARASCRSRGGWLARSASSPARSVRSRSALGSGGGGAAGRSRRSTASSDK